VDAAILSIGGGRRPGSRAAAFSGAGAADVGELPIISDELLSGVGDMGGQGGAEVECGTGNRAWRTLTGATLMILGGAGDLSGLGIIL
jgi:hypothetical protein